MSPSSLLYDLDGFEESPPIAMAEDIIPPGCFCRSSHFCCKFVFQMFEQDRDVILTVMALNLFWS